MEVLSQDRAGWRKVAHELNSIGSDKKTKRPSCTTAAVKNVQCRYCVYRFLSYNVNR